MGGRVRPSPSARRAYASFAQRYADIAPTKAHNALYERTATMALLGDVDILNALADAGWQLERFVEPRPLPEMKAVSERFHAELSLAPAFLCIRARC
ncbi:hypothetical protein [Burkholderia anthina]|uniref:hypothetical protein n=1 Tax=Burkholderia anthina TaxID=179879 RepID=UPI0015897950